MFPKWLLNEVQREQQYKNKITSILIQIMMALNEKFYTNSLIFSVNYMISDGLRCKSLSIILKNNDY